MLKVILKTKGGKYKHRSQISSTEAGEARKEEMEVCSISLFLQGESPVTVSFLMVIKRERSVGIWIKMSD